MRLPSLQRRQVTLAIALLATLAATTYIAINDREAGPVIVAQADRSVLPVASLSQQRTDSPADALQARNLPEAERDIFAPHKSPAAEPKPPVAPTAAPMPSPLVVTDPPPMPPQPVAPPLPFTYVGKLGDGGRYTIFLSLRGRNYAVKAGDLVAQTYRVEEITPPTMTLTYLPMNTRQTMQIGEAN